MSVTSSLNQTQIAGLYRIVDQRLIAADTYELKLQGDLNHLLTAPGQFVNIKINSDSTEPLLRRPISVCDWDEQGNLTLIYKVVGRGTELLSQKKVGDQLDLLVGLGNGFPVDRPIKKALLIGCGVGVPPLYALAKKLLAQGIEVQVLLGFSHQKQVFYEQEFKDLGCREVTVFTSCGDHGCHGHVTDILDQENAPDFDEYFACGPQGLLNDLVRRFPQNGWLSYEARMGCGFGACMGCTCQTKKGPKRLCHEGPILHSSEVEITN